MTIAMISSFDIQDNQTVASLSRSIPLSSPKQLEPSQINAKWRLIAILPAVEVWLPMLIQNRTFASVRWVDEIQFPHHSAPFRTKPRYSAPFRTIYFFTRSLTSSNTTI